MYTILIDSTLMIVKLNLENNIVCINYIIFHYFRDGNKIILKMSYLLQT